MSESNPKILIVDDDDSVRTMYVEIFKNEDFEVIEATDGLDGLEKAIKENPSIIFTGIMMPRMDGFAFVSELKKNVATNNIPVMMISHMGRKEDHDRAKEMGVRDFIVQGMVSPKSVVERARSLFKSGDYSLRIIPSELDAVKLANDIGINDAYICDKCGSEMILNLEIGNLSTKELTGRFVCPKCGSK